MINFALSEDLLNDKQIVPRSIAAFLVERSLPINDESKLIFPKDNEIMIKRKINILMLGGAKRVSLAEQLIRAGKNLGVEVSIFSHELSEHEPIASVGQIIVGSKYTEKGIDDEISHVIECHGIDVVLPFIDPAIELAARVARRHPDVFIPVSSEEVARAMFDKSLAAEWFERAGIPIPTTYTPDNITYPAILKPRTGSASRGILVVENEEELSRAPLPIDEYLIQEYIADRDEYTVDCYVGTTDGEVKCAVPRLRLATAGGEVIRTETRRIPAVMSLSERTLKELKFRGPVTLQFIFDRRNQRFLLMEVNPRLGGGVICSIMAGADIAKMILEECEGMNAAPCRVWRDGTLMTRYFREVMFYK